MSRFWYENCPVCDQGRVFVQRKTSSRDLFLECEECYTGWNNPHDLSDADSGFLSIEVASVDASADDIIAAGWGEHSFHISQD